MGKSFLNLPSNFEKVVIFRICLLTSPCCPGGGFRNGLLESWSCKRHQFRFCDHRRLHLVNWSFVFPFFFLPSPPASSHFQLQELSEKTYSKIAHLERRGKKRAKNLSITRDVNVVLSDFLPNLNNVQRQTLEIRDWKGRRLQYAIHQWTFLLPSIGKEREGAEKKNSNPPNFHSPQKVPPGKWRFFDFQTHPDYVTLEKLKIEFKFTSSSTGDRRGMTQNSFRLSPDARNSKSQLTESSKG